MALRGPADATPEAIQALAERVLSQNLEIARLRSALEKLRDGPGNRMSMWPGTWTHEVAAAALQTEKVDSR